MICALVFVAHGHMFINGYGSWFYKACYYDCGTRPYSWYDRVYRVDPEYYCPVEFRKT